MSATLPEAPCAGDPVRVVSSIRSGWSTASSRYSATVKPDACSSASAAISMPALEYPRAPLGRSDRLATIERVPTRMTQQVTQRASRLPDRIVEAEHPLLRRHQDRPRHERLRQRGERVPSGDVTDGVDDLAPDDDAGADVGNRPSGGEIEGRHRVAAGVIR